jgi:hypothetical protein
MIPSPALLKPEGGAVIDGSPKIMPLLIADPGAPGSPF